MSYRSRLICVTAVAALMVPAGCATQRPVLYPNAKFKQVGPEVAQKDIDECISMAESHGITHENGGNVARSSATGAVIGGAAGAGESGSVYKSFVQRCLRERGYDDIAWK